MCSKSPIHCITGNCRVEDPKKNYRLEDPWSVGSENCGHGSWRCFFISDGSWSCFFYFGWVLELNFKIHHRYYNYRLEDPRSVGSQNSGLRHGSSTRQLPVLKRQSTIVMFIMSIGIFERSI